MMMQILQLLWRIHRTFHEQAEKTKCTERQKTSFPKESVENVGLYKPALNKIMTTYD